VTFKERTYRCQACDAQEKRLAWNTDAPPACDAHGPMVETDRAGAAAPAVVDDTIIGGRWVETLGHEPVWIESHSQLRREAEKRGLVNVVRHDDAYYARQRKQHDEYLRDTGQLVTQPRRH
jgi:hypothetical protein